MYSSCLFCSHQLGRNESIELLPVGRRLAFDQERGRLWVVCRWCGRWNLTPVDDRWEPIEACERRFRTTRVRASSDQIGLARLPDGTELIRIGRPLRNEFAAWRYGTHFLERHRRRVRQLGVPPAGLLWAAPVAAFAAGPLAALGFLGAAGVSALGRARRSALVIPFERGEHLSLSFHHVQDTRLVRDDDLPEGWSLEIGHLTEPSSLQAFRLGRRFAEERVTLAGSEARMAAAMILPMVNARGGSLADVAEAVRWLEVTGGPARAIANFAKSGLVRPPLVSQREPMRSMHPEVRLALEMALHEEEERRALEGELSVLEWVWRREERLASIADRLGVPESVEAQLDDLKRGISRVVPTRPAAAPE